MPILILCINSSCGEFFHVPDDAAGTQVRCPACGTPQNAPAAHVAPATAAAVKPQPPPAADEMDLRTIADCGPVAGPSPRQASADTLDVQAAMLSAETQTPAAGGPDEAGTSVAPRASDRVLGVAATRVVLVIGVAGATMGLLVGVFCFPGWSVLTAYACALGGWVVGLILSFLCIHISERDDPGELRCAACGSVQPPQTEVCSWCGSSLAASWLNPLTAGCLSAGSYAFRNRWSIVKMAMILLLLTVAADGTMLALRTYPTQTGFLQWPAMVLGAIVAFNLFGGVLQFFLDIVRLSAVSQGLRVPQPPLFWSGANVLAGIKGLGLAAVYILPASTIPLLPLGLTSLATRIDHAFNPLAMLRLLRQCDHDFVILWLLGLLWVSGMLVALGGVIFMVGLLDSAIPTSGTIGTILEVILDGFRAALIGLVVGVFGTAVFRCIGLFARFNARTLLGPHAPALPLDA